MWRIIVDLTSVQDRFSRVDTFFRVLDLANFPKFVKLCLKMGKCHASISHLHKFFGVISPSLCKDVRILTFHRVVNCVEPPNYPFLRCDFEVTSRNGRRSSLTKAFSVFLTKVRTSSFRGLVFMKKELRNEFC